MQLDRVNFIRTGKYVSQIFMFLHGTFPGQDQQIKQM